MQTLNTDEKYAEYWVKIKQKILASKTCHQFCTTIFVLFILKRITRNHWRTRMVRQHVSEWTHAIAGVCVMTCATSVRQLPLLVVIEQIGLVEQVLKIELSQLTQLPVWREWVHWSSNLSPVGGVARPGVRRRSRVVQGVMAAVAAVPRFSHSSSRGASLHRQK